MSGGIFLDKELRYKELMKTSVVTIAGNFVLAVFKVIIGFISGSSAVVADAVHTLSDVFSTVVVMAGLKFSSKDADPEHQYGHQRIESIVSLILAFILFVTALSLGWEGVKKITENEVVKPSIPALVITVISILSKEVMFRYTMKKAKLLNSSSLMSDAWHHRSDAVSSIAVLIGVVGVFFNAWILEPIATIAVSFIILKAVYDIGRLAIDQLIDRAVSKELLSEIKDTVLSINGVKGIDLLHTRLSNNVVFVDLEISVDSNLTVSEGHDIAENVHDTLEKNITQIQHCMVHVNPHVER